MTTHSRPSAIYRVVPAMISLGLACGASSQALAALVGRNFISVDSSPGGVSDFGLGRHNLGSPGAGLVEWDYTTPIGPGPLSVTAHVQGRLYFDKVCLNAFLIPEHCHGHARVTVFFLDANRTQLNRRDIDIDDVPGNDANLLANQAPVDVSFTHPSLQIVQILCSGAGKESFAPKGMNRSDVFADSGKVFFGGPSYGDAPNLPADGALAGIFRRDTTMNGGVIGTLYWNSSASGSALLEVAFARRDGVAINAQRFLLRNALGGNPNGSQNHMPVNLPNFFTDPQLFQIRMTVGEATFTRDGAALFGRSTVSTTFTFRGSVTGDFNLSPSYPTVAARDEQDFLVRWTVHDPQVWRDLKTLDFRLRDDRSTALWVRWDEAANTFQLCRATAHAGHGEDDHDTGHDSARDHGHGDDRAADVVCGQALAPGSDAAFETSSARLDLEHSSVTGTGPNGASVSLILPVSFKSAAAGRTFTVELAASDDLGGQDVFFAAGTVTVERDGPGGH